MQNRHSPYTIKAKKKKSTASQHQDPASPLSCLYKWLVEDA